jgi:hypothetical protein
MARALSLWPLQLAASFIQRAMGQGSDNVGTSFTHGGLDSN